MRIKKKTSIMMATATTLAAVGIAAVSFAAWTGNNTVLTASADIGTVSYFGFTEDQNSEVTSLGTLVPYDQEDNSILTGTKFISFALPEFSVFEDYQIQVTYAPTLSTEATTTEYKFYATVGNQITDAPESVTGWQQLSDQAQVFNFTATANTNTVVNGAANKTVYFNLILESNEKESTFEKANFTIKLVTASATDYISD